MNKIIEVKRLSKNFGKVQAIKDISFYVEERYSFLIFRNKRGWKVNDDFDFVDAFETRYRRSECERLHSWKTGRQNSKGIRCRISRQLIRSPTNGRRKLEDSWLILRYVKKRNKQCN